MLLLPELLSFHLCSLPLGWCCMSVGCVLKENVTGQLCTWRWLHSFLTHGRLDSLFLKYCISIFVIQNKIMEVSWKYWVCRDFLLLLHWEVDWNKSYTTLLLKKPSHHSSKGTMCLFIWKNIMLCFWIKNVSILKYFCIYSV